MIEREAESLSIQCLQSAEAFEQLRAIWQSLERFDTACTPFNTWAWNSLWWQHHGTSRDTLALLVVSEGRRVVAIAPFYLHAARLCKVMPIQTLRFVGSGKDTSTNYLNILALPAMRDVVELAILQYLPQIRGWQKLQLSGMAENSTLARRAAALLTRLPGMALSPRHQVIRKARLPDTVDEYRAQSVGEQISHRQHQLDAAGQVEMSICASSEELGEACDALHGLHRLGRGRKQEEGGYPGVAGEPFHRAVIRQFFAADALWLATLKLDGNIIAVHYLFVWRGELLFMQRGYSPDHESLSPDPVLFTHVIQRGIEQGMIGLDMLNGPCSDEPITAWNETRTVDISYVRPGVRGLIAAADDRLRQRRIRTIRISA